MTSKRENILADIKETIETIIAGATYTNTIRTVTRSPIDYDELPDDQLPLVIIDDIRNGTENLIPYTTKDINSLFELDLIVVYRANSNLSTGVNSIIEDVKKAIYVDTSRNNNADMTHIVNVTSEKTEKKNTIIINFRISVDYVYPSDTP